MALIMQKSTPEQSRDQDGRHDIAVSQVGCITQKDNMCYNVLTMKYFHEIFPQPN